MDEFIKECDSKEYDTDMTNEQLIEAIKSGKDTELNWKRLIKKNAGCLINTFVKLKGRGFNPGDCFSCVIYSFYNMVFSYDSERGRAFSTYIYNWLIYLSEKELFKEEYFIKDPYKNRFTKLYQCTRMRVNNFDSLSDDEKLKAMGLNPNDNNISILTFAKNAAVQLFTSSVDVKIPSPERGKDMLIEDIVCDGYNMEKGVLFSIWNEEFKQSLNDFQKEVYEQYFLNGLTQKTIAEKLNTSQSYISRTIKKIVKKASEMLSENSEDL